MNGFIKRSAWITTTLLGWAMMASLAQAASFDCAKAGTKVEHLICDTPEISKLDDELSAAYKIALQNGKQADSIKQAQKQWMKKRNGCEDAGCVKRAYAGRLKALGISDRSTDPNEAKSAEQEFAQKPPKLRYAFCDKSKPGLECEGQTGKGYSVCEAYLGYLQTLSNPPTCEAPSPPGFKQPDWEEMDVTQNLDLAYQAEGFSLKSFGGYKHPDFDTWRQTFLHEIHEGKINPRIRKAKVTPNDKGYATILAYTRDREACHKNFEWEKRAKPQRDQLPEEMPAWRKAKQIPGYPYPYWTRQGDVHFTLTDDTPPKLQVIVGRVSRSQMDLLVYAGRSYLVKVIDPLAPIYKPRGGNPPRKMGNSSIVIYAFDPRFPDTRPNLDLNHYMAEPRCQLLPY